MIKVKFIILLFSHEQFLEWFYECMKCLVGGSMMCCRVPSFSSISDEVSVQSIMYVVTQIRKYHIRIIDNFTIQRINHDVCGGMGKLFTCSNCQNIRSSEIHGRFIRNTIVMLCRTPGLLSRLPQFSGWSPQGFSKETFLWDFWSMIASQLLQIRQLHVHAVILPFYHIPKVYYWIQIWWLGRSLKYTEPLWDDRFQYANAMVH